LEAGIDFFRTNPNLLLIQPEPNVGPNVGLIPKHFDMINAFIEDRIPEEEMFTYRKTLPLVDN
jgi:hypothetical protein